MELYFLSLQLNLKRYMGGWMINDSGSESDVHGRDEDENGNGDDNNDSR